MVKRVAIRSIRHWPFQLLTVLALAGLLGGLASLLVTNLMGNATMVMNLLAALLFLCNAVMLFWSKALKLRLATPMVLASALIMWAYWPLALYGL